MLTPLPTIYISVQYEYRYESNVSRSSSGFATTCHIPYYPVMSLRRNFVASMNRHDPDMYQHKLHYIHCIYINIIIQYGFLEI